MKKNIWKRLLSLALALVMVVGLLPMMSLTAYAATGKDNNSGISVTVNKSYCNYCEHFIDCYIVAIKSVSVSEKTLTIVIECTTIDHGVYEKHNNTSGEVKDTITITNSNFSCTTAYNNATMSHPWNAKSNSGHDYGSTQIKVSRAAGHKVTSWTNNNNGTHSGNCALCGAVEEDCKMSAANCTTPATCSGCGYIKGSTDANAHNWGDWTTSNGRHIRTCTLNTTHTESGNCDHKPATCLAASACSVCEYKYAAQLEHSYTYTANGSVLTEKCDNGCGHSKTATLQLKSGTDLTYTGTAIEPFEMVYPEGWIGAQNQPASTDYTNNVNAGTDTASCSFTYADGATVSNTFTIEPANLYGCEVEMTPPSGTYTGSYHDTPTYTLTYNDKQLDKGIDYIVDANWSGDFLNAGSHNLVLEGKGNFTGTKTLTYTIEKATPTFTAPTAKELTYNGEPLALVEAGSVNPGKLLYRLDGGEYSETVPTATNAGNYTVYYKVVDLDTDNYNEISSGSVSVTISKAAAPTITFPTVLNAITYGQKLEEAKLSSYANDYGTFSWNAPTSVPNAGNAGYALDFYPNALALQNYDWKDAGEAQWIANRNALCVCPNVTVNKAAAAITTNPIPNNLTYNGEDQPLVTAGSVTGGTLVYSLEKEGTYTADLPQAMDVGTYTVWYQVEADSNHTASAAPASVTVEIKKANASVDVAPTAIAVYNGREQYLITSTYSMGGTVLYSLDGINYTESLPKGTNAQEYTVYYKVVGDANHNDMEPKTVTATIAPWNIETAFCKAGVWGEPFTYNGQEHTPTPQIDVWVNDYPVPGNPYAPGADVRLTKDTDYTVTYSNNVNAGQAVVTFTGKGNYTGTITKKFTIDPKPITVTIADKTSVYGEAVAELTAATDGIVNNDTNVYSLATTATSTANAGTYPITGTTLNNNYKITFVGGTYTITKATNQWTTEPSITGWTYGETASTPSGKAKFGAVTVTYAEKGKDTFTSEVPTQAGDYTAKFIVADTANYNGLTATVDFTIAKKPLTVIEAAATGREYDGTKTVAITAVTLDGIVGEDTVAVDLTDLTGTLESANKGTYTSVTLPELKLKDDKGNYTLTQPAAAVKTNVEITAKPITVTVADIADQTWTGSALTPAVVSPTGLVKETDEYCTVTYTDNTNVGLATVKVEEKGNYTFTAIEKTFLIVPNELLIANLTTENVTSANKANVDKAVQMMNNADLNDAPAEDKAAWEALKTLANDLQDQLEAADAADETQNIQDVEGINAGNVKLDQKQDLKDALKDLESAKENYYGNYTAKEKAALEADIKRVEDALAAIERVEDFNNAIDDPLLKEDVKTDMDAATEAAIKDAQDAYNALSDYEKTLVDPADKTRLGKLVATITDYKVTKGDGGRYTVGSGKTLSFTANGPVRKFDYVQVNGKTIASSNYTVTEGSTIITLKSSYLDKLGYGKHKIQIFYTDGSTDVANFRIYVSGGNPFTGDNTHMLFFTGIMMTSLLCMVMMAMFATKKKGKHRR